MTSLEMRQSRAKLIADARKIMQGASDEKRSLNAEDREQIDKLMSEADNLGDEIKRIERVESAERDLENSTGRVADDNEKRRVDPNPTPTPQVDPTEVYQRSFNSYLKRGFQGMNPDEYRALSADNMAEGGYVIAPQQFVNSLIKAVDDMVFIRQLATKHSLTSAASLGVPSLDNDPADADWTSELATGSEDSTMSFGKRELEPKPLAKRIKVSNKLLQRSSMGVDALVQDRLRYKFGITEEKAYLTGSGSGQPLGIFTANANGISTSRDKAFAATTAFDADALIDTYYHVKGPYRNTGVWGFHRDGIREIRQLKGSDNNYLWQPGLRGGEPDTLLGRPIYESEYIPNTYTAGLYAGFFGDVRFYHIAEVSNVSIQRLVELYAETNQVGFIGRRELDGMPVLEEAFARIKMAAS